MIGLDIAVYGLTGDPVTSAHREIIKYLSEHYEAVIVVPTNINYYKQYKGHDRAMFSFVERYDMLVDACKPYRNVTVSDVERDKDEGWRYVDTLDELREQYGTDNYYFTAMGSDSFQNFTTWWDWQGILDESKLIVFTRPGYEDNYPDVPVYELVEMNNSASSTALRSKLNRIMASDDFENMMGDIGFAIDSNLSPIDFNKNNTEEE